MEIIYVTDGEAVLKGGTLRDINGVDISGYTFTLGLSASDDTPPLTWAAPNVSVAGTTTAERTLKILVNSSAGVGRWFVWSKTVGAPETLFDVLCGPFETQ